ncbi:MAG: hypothetical protein JW726_02070 [Anaerolineales bacterium]|nr:hypothetical protein [Anaerolineales bacterium]
MSKICRSYRDWWTNTAFATDPSTVHRKQKRFFLLALIFFLALACRSSQGSTPDAPDSRFAPTVVPPPTHVIAGEADTTPGVEDLPAPTVTAVPQRVITANDYIPEQTNLVDTLVVLVNFSGRPEQTFDLSQYWERIFGLEDPIRQVNAYYQEVFYGQLQLHPLWVYPQGYVEVELPGLPGDYTFGWLVGYESDEIASVDPEAGERLVLDIMALVVEQQPALDYQDTFVIIVLNALGAEYGRGAAGVLPTGGVDPVYDLFVGKASAEDRVRYTGSPYFRLVGEDRLVGVIRHSGYTYADYFRDRSSEVDQDQFLLGIGLFGRDAPLSCAVHDILHGLRRKSAYADPPEGRSRAVNCLYNLPLQSQWLVGNDEHGRFDRSVNASPYIGWWDPMGDHLHPAQNREFFSSMPHGFSAFTRLGMGMIPPRCIAVANSDEQMIQLAPLSNPTLPALGAAAEALVVKVPLMPDNPDLAHVYLLMEYRRRVGELGEHPDNFSIAPDFVFGDVMWDPGYNAANPEQSHLVNPPTQFVSDEGVLVYLVNEKMSSLPVLPYDPQEWYRFVVVLLNPAGNANRANLTQAALGAGESMDIDFRTLYADTGAPIVIRVVVDELTADAAVVHIIRQQVR